MKVEVEESIRCRSYSLILDREATDLHWRLMADFIERGVESPRGGGSGPYFKDMRAVEGKSHIQHFLNEEVCEEYEQKMGMAPQSTPSPSRP